MRENSSTTVVFNGFQPIVHPFACVAWSWLPLPWFFVLVIFVTLAMLVKYLKIPEETYPLLKDCEILIMDALRPDRSSSTHFGLPKALEEVRKIQLKRTLFTGQGNNKVLHL
ncbi:hypothetical protein CsatB_012302 [Cannabis sativa]